MQAVCEGVEEVEDVLRHGYDGGDAGSWGVDAGESWD